MSEYDFIMISQSEVVRYEQYNKLPLNRLDLYKSLVQLRMVFFEDGFRSHLDLFNKILYGTYFHEASYEERRCLFNIWNMPGLNGISTVSPLIKHGIRCRIINNFDSEYDNLLSCCKESDNPIVGISTTFILQWTEIARIADKISKDLPGAILILGGAFVCDQYVLKGSGHFEKPMRKYNIQYIIHSFNSEKDLLNLVKNIISKNKNFSHINNLAYIDNHGEFRTTDVVWNDPEIQGSAIPWEEIYTPSFGSTLQIRTASGCPFRCAFCNYPSSANGFHVSSVEDVEVQLEAINRLSNVEAIVFIDDTINAPNSRFNLLLSVLKKYRFRWYAFFRTQFLDETTAKNLKESGCDGLYLGLESASNKVLENMNKKAKADDYIKGVALLKKYDIPIFAMFILGFPGETEETIQDNISFIENNGIDYYSAKEFYYLHSSPVHARKDEFSLEGEGNKWKHRTMNSAQASKMKLHMFDSIKNSTYIDPDMGLWYLIYLRERGFGWSKIKASQTIINQMSKEDNLGNYNDKETLFEDLKNVISRKQ
ncbi:MAG: radical SAM protein [Nitrospirae bacterium]|nr:radical SAM protein [Nitrospirota bacterium]MBF0553594.1 radical SAM protein [Nitrospirota bacterium]